MKNGLDEFLKRIEAKPNNETLIDRFMTLVLEEEGVDRILYLKGLVGVLLKNNPYAALKAAYVELQEARKEKLSNEYEVGALKDVESCFIKLGKADNATLIREEISKLQTDATRIQTLKPSKPVHNQSQNTLQNQKQNATVFEFPQTPPMEEPLVLVPMNTPEHTRMTNAPHQNLVSSEAADPSEALAPKLVVKKTIPGLQTEHTAVAKMEPDATDLMNFELSLKRSNSTVVSSAPAVAPVRQAPTQLFAEPNLFGIKPLQKDLSSISNLNEPSIIPPTLEQEPLRTSRTPLQANLAAFPSGSDHSTDEPDESYGFELEYTKRADASEARGISVDPRSDSSIDESARPKDVGKSVSTRNSFSLADDIEDDVYISASSAIDENYENQPFFQPDDDDDEELPPAERTMLISLENLHESKEQINLATTSSATVKDVKYPINSGHQFVILDTDDDAADSSPFTSTTVSPVATHGGQASVVKLAAVASPLSLNDLQPEPQLPAPAAIQVPIIFEPEPTPLRESSFAEVTQNRASTPVPGAEYATSLVQKVASIPINPWLEAPIPQTDMIAEEKDQAFSVEVDDEPPTIQANWAKVQERLKLLSGLQIGRSHALDYVKRLLDSKVETPEVLHTLNLLLQFVQHRLDEKACLRIATWMFEELDPRAMHQLWSSLSLKDEGVQLYLAHIDRLTKVHQHRRALSIMHDLLQFDLDMVWYSQSYPSLVKVWDELGLEGWSWLEEEGGQTFCDRLARREDPLIAALLG